MGWDAFSVPLEADWTTRGDPAWEPVVASFRNRGMVYDALLPHGGLDVSTCGEMLARATGRDVYGQDWSAPEVVEIAAAADWTFAVEADDVWAKESARAFLDHCARLGRGVRFSW